MTSLSIRTMSIGAVLVAFVIGCNEPVPIKSMADARHEISRAQSVKADKYAPVEFEAAQAKLLECHKLLKKAEYKDAEKASNLSGKYAREAFDKSVPLLAKETIDVAETSLAQARDAYADELAKDEYGLAEKTLQKSQEQFQNKQYYDAYLSALEADKLAKNAYNSALGKKDLLKDEIAGVEQTLQESEKYGVQQYAPEKYNLARENVKLAGDSYNSLELKKGFSAIEVAKINADDALMASMAGTAKEKLAAAKELVEKAKASKGAAAAKDDLAAAMESVGNAEKLLGDTQYADSIAASDEAVRLAGNVLNASDQATIATTTDDNGTSTTVTDDQNNTNNAQNNGTVDNADNGEFLLYTVKYRERLRDCLWRIAGKFYKEPTLWKEIYNANKDQIKNPDFILPGWVLKVPKKYIK